MELIRRNSDYGLRVLMRMAGQPIGTVFSVGALVRQEGVPEGFLYKILQKLARAGIVMSLRGPQGGFALSRPPSEITVRAVLEALQGPLAISRCFLGRKCCSNQAVCMLRRGLRGLQKSMVSLFESVTLESLAERQARGVGKRDSGVLRAVVGSD